MTIYYASSIGSDSNAGTSTALPFLTAAHALAVAADGDTINLRSGDVFAENLVPTVGGLTMQSYGGGMATVAGGGGFAWHSLNLDGFTLSNLIFTQSSGTQRSVVEFETTGVTNYTRGITVTGCDISGAVNCGLRFYHSTNDIGTVTNVSITNNVVHDCLLAGMYILGSGATNGKYNYSALTISGNTVHDINSNSTHGAGWGINLSNCNAAAGPTVVSGNTCYNFALNASPTIGGAGVGIQLLMSNGVIVKGNSITNSVSNATIPNGPDGTGIDMDQGCDNCIIEYNFISSCACGISNFTDVGHGGNVWRFNCVIDCGKTGPSTSTRGALNFAGTTDGQGGLIVHNNTVIVTTTRPAIYGIFGLTNKKIYDNVFGVPVGSNVIFLSNIGMAGGLMDGNYYRQVGGTGFSASVGGTTYSTFAAFQSGTGQEANGAVLAAAAFIGPTTPVPSVTAANIFPNDFPYFPSSVSPVYHGGRDLQTLYGINPGTQDLNGNPIPVPYSAGAINATARYVSSAGSDAANGGTTATPWLTLTFAATNTNIGDAILLNGGNTFPEFVSLTSSRILQSYGTGQATIASPAGHDVAITWTNTGNTAVNNLIVKGPTTTYAGVFHRIIEHLFSDNVLYNNFFITNCNINTGLGGVVFINSGSAHGYSCNNIWYTGNTSFNLGNRGGMETGFAGTPGQRYFKNITVTDNVIHGILGIQQTSQYAIAMEGVSNAYVARNLCYDIGSTWVPGGVGTGPQGLEVLSSDNIMVVGNVFRDMITTGNNTNSQGSGMTVDGDSQNVSLIGNIVYNSGGCGIEWWATNASSNITIAFNLCINCCTYASLITNRGVIHVGNSSTGGASGQIYNNTIVSGGNFPALAMQAGTAVNKTISNNILTSPAGIASADVPSGTAPFVLNGNAYLSGASSFSVTYNGTNYTSLAAFQAGSAREANAIALTGSPFVGPLTPIPAIVPGSFALDAPYSLSTGNVLIGAALNLIDLYAVYPGTQDLNGNAIPVPYSRGAINSPYVPPVTPPARRSTGAFMVCH